MQHDEAQDREDREDDGAVAEGRRQRIDERHHDEAGDDEQHVEEALEHHARERRAHPHPDLATEQRRPHQLADPKRQHGRRPEADRRCGQSGEERHVAERAEKHPPALRAHVDGHQAGEHHGSHPEGPGRNQDGTHARPVGAACREVQAPE